MSVVKFKANHSEPFSAITKHYHSRPTCFIKNSLRWKEGSVLVLPESPPISILQCMNVTAKPFFPRWSGSECSVSRMVGDEAASTGFGEHWPSGCQEGLGRAGGLQQNSLRTQPGVLKHLQNPLPLLAQVQIHRLHLSRL